MTENGMTSKVGIPTELGAKRYRNTVGTMRNGFIVLEWGITKI